VRGRRSAETPPHRPVAEGQREGGLGAAQGLVREAGRRFGQAERGQGQQAVRQAPGEVAGALRDLLAR
jgi:hypothetical protein